MVFDWVGVAAPLANALRRVLLAEVPAMAIEKVILYQNTSIIQDEVLSHRLGLVPLKIDPREFEFVHEAGHPNEKNTLVFTLDVTCTRAPNVPDSAANEEKYVGSLVHSSELKWQPFGRQAKKFSGDNVIRPYYDDIVLAKLRPGQSIEAELHVEKGIGSAHAKWSPVSTASYRLLPDIQILQPLKGAVAEQLVEKCPMNVFDIEDGHAIVARPRQCTMCRECIRGDGWEDRVALRRMREHFVYSVETTGAYEPAETVRQAFAIIGAKARRVSEFMKQSMNDMETTSAAQSSNSPSASPATEAQKPKGRSRKPQ